ncbi:hypothetical protein V7S43_014476 [Phytophthora oleae]|uniref:Uncharacterized protein n=1 Tax=Phytophthora oleae TaxID=2107226 RepID=A0ABD3F2X8_9STRA
MSPLDPIAVPQSASPATLEEIQQNRRLQIEKLQAALVQMHKTMVDTNQKVRGRGRQTRGEKQGTRMAQFEKGCASVKSYVWSRKDIPRGERGGKDERFHRSREGRCMRARYLQSARGPGPSSDRDDDDDPKDEVAVLENTLRASEIQICGAPDSKLLRKLREESSCPSLGTSTEAV